MDSDAKSKIDVISPNTEEVIGRVPDATPNDVDRAVAAAREAFDKGPFPRWSPEERADGDHAPLRGAQEARPGDREDDLVRERLPDLDVARHAGVRVDDGARRLRRHREELPVRREAQGRDGADGVRAARAGRRLRALIVPWNVPLYVIAMKLGPALAAGCTVVVKAAPETALDPYGLMEAVQDAGPAAGRDQRAHGRPRDQRVPGQAPGHRQGELHGQHRHRPRIGAICGEQIKRCTLELGGKSAGIVLEDVNLAAAVPQMLGAGLLNNGQACAAQTRFLAPRSATRRSWTRWPPAWRAMKVGRLARPGHPDRPGRGEAPARQDPRLPRRREEGRRQDRLRRRRAEGPDKGWFIDPTLFYDVNNQMTIAREEIFGPVLVVIPYDSEEQAIAIANDSDFGLGGGVWCGDNAHGVEVARQIRTGAITVNTAMLLDFRSPFGGFKKSGIGRECGPEGLAPYTEYQSIVMPMGT